MLDFGDGGEGEIVAVGDVLNESEGDGLDDRDSPGRNKPAR